MQHNEQIAFENRLNGMLAENMRASVFLYKASLTFSFAIKLLNMEHVKSHDLGFVYLQIDKNHLLTDKIRKYFYTLPSQVIANITMADIWYLCFKSRALLPTLAWGLFDLV